MSTYSCRLLKSSSIIHTNLYTLALLTLKTFILVGLLDGISAQTYYTDFTLNRQHQQSSQDLHSDSSTESRQQWPRLNVFLALSSSALRMLEISTGIDVFAEDRRRQNAYRESKAWFSDELMLKIHDRYGVRFVRSEEHSQNDLVTREILREFWIQAAAAELPKLDLPNEFIVLLQDLNLYDFGVYYAIRGLRWEGNQWKETLLSLDDANVGSIAIYTGQDPNAPVDLEPLSLAREMEFFVEALERHFADDSREIKYSGAEYQALQELIAEHLFELEGRGFKFKLPGSIGIYDEGAFPPEKMHGIFLALHHILTTDLDDQPRLIFFASPINAMPFENDESTAILNSGVVIRRYMNCHYIVVTESSALPTQAQELLDARMKEILARMPADM